MLLFVLLCAGVSSVKAQVTVDGLVYRISSNLAYLSGVTDNSQTEITIPATITYVNNGTETTTPVAGIYPSAFLNKSGLKTVTVATNTRYFTFQPSCFEGCTTLEKVLFENASQNRYYYSRAFKNCTALTQVGATANRVQLSNNLTAEQEEVFMGCTSIQGINYRYSQTKIGPRMFKGCTALTAPNLVNASSVGESAFEGCTALTSVNVTTTSASVVNMTFGPNCFKGCTALTMFVFDQMRRPITEIPAGMFDGCTALKQVYSTYRNIDDGKNYYGSLNGIATIGAKAFNGCAVLATYGMINSSTNTSVIFPDDLTAIGDSAFFGCATINRVNLYNLTAPTLGVDAFTGIAAGSNFYLIPTNSYTSASSYALNDAWKVYFDGTKASNTFSAYVNKSKLYGTVSCDVPLYFRYSSTANVYKVVSTDDTSATLEAGARRLPANTGAIIEMGVNTSTQEQYTSTQVQVLFDNSAKQEVYQDNLLVANVAENTNFVGQQGNTWNMIMNDGKFVKATDGTLAAGLAYLPWQEVEGTTELALVLGGTTGIDNAVTDKQVDKAINWYTINGVKLNGKPNQKGIYILNGKKVVVK